MHIRRGDVPPAEDARLAPPRPVHGARERRALHLRQSRGVRTSGVTQLATWAGRRSLARGGLLVCALSCHWPGRLLGGGGWGGGGGGREGEPGRANGARGGQRGGGAAPSLAGPSRSSTCSSPVIYSGPFCSLCRALLRSGGSWRRLLGPGRWPGSPGALRRRGLLPQITPRPWAASPCVCSAQIMAAPWGVRVRAPRRGIRPAWLVRSCSAGGPRA